MVPVITIGVNMLYATTKSWAVPEQSRYDLFSCMYMAVDQEILYICVSWPAGASMRTLMK